MFVAGSGHVVLKSTYGVPRLNSHHAPEITSLALEPNIAVDTTEDRTLRGRLIRKAINGCLRASAQAHPGWLGSFSHATLKMALRARTNNLSQCQAICSSTLGMDPLLLNAPTPSFLVGYFQTWRLVHDRDVLPRIRSMVDDAQSSPWLDHLRSIALTESPLVVHVRLGDYKENPHFGTVSSNYYFRAIGELGGLANLGRIWLFSDEPDAALNMLGPQFSQHKPRIISPTRAASSTDTLRAMALGAHFVLSNSTFGWWGANLSASDCPSVVVPAPWFVEEQSPVDLVAPAWIARSRE